MGRRFIMTGNLIEIFDEVAKLNAQNKNASVVYGPFLVENKGVNPSTYEVLISCLRD